MTQTRVNIEQMVQPDEIQEDETYCEICYTNTVTPPSISIEEGDLDTVEFECGHRFCSDCTVEQFKQHIEQAKVDKLACFNYECQKPVSDE